MPRNLDQKKCGCGWDGVRSRVGTWMITCVWLITSLETFDDEIFFGEKYFMFFFFFDYIEAVNKTFGETYHNGLGNIIQPIHPPKGSCAKTFPEARTSTCRRHRCNTLKRPSV